MPIKSKKILKIVAGVIIFFTLPSILFFGFLYFKYNEDLPTGIKIQIILSGLLESVTIISGTKLKKSVKYIGKSIK